MTTIEEMGSLRKEVLKEQEQRQKTIKDRIQKLVRYSIPDLISLREHWVVERKRNKKVDDLSIQKRREAESWIEAIDTVLQSGKTPDTKRSKKEIDKSPVQSYIEALVRLNMSTPLLDDLDRATGISPATWSRHLKDPAFAMVLKRAIQKKLHYAKTEEKKNFWEFAEAGVDDVIAKIHSRLRHLSNPSYNAVAPPSIGDGHIDPEVGDIIIEDMDRAGQGNSDIDESD